MHVVTQHFRKPGEEGTFFNQSAEFKAYVKTNYKDTNKLLSTDATFNPVEKVLIVVNNWVNQEAYNEYRADPVVSQMLFEREQYNTANGIQMSFRDAHDEND